MPAAKKTVDKFKKKKWYELYAPKAFDRKLVGETPAEKSKLLVGRMVKVTVDELTGQRKLRHISAKFRVSEVKELKAYTEVTGFEVNHSYLRRMVRRRVSKIVAVVTGTTKDGKVLRATAVAVSSHRLERKKEKAIRKILRDSIAEEIPKKSLEQIVQEMIFGLVSTNIIKKAKGIDRLKRVEITKARVMEGK